MSYLSFLCESNFHALVNIFFNMPKGTETSERGGEADILPPPSPSVPVAANVALKLPVFWSAAAEV